MSLVQKVKNYIITKNAINQSKNQLNGLIRISSTKQQLRQTKQNYKFGLRKILPSKLSPQKITLNLKRMNNSLIKKRLIVQHSTQFSNKHLRQTSKGKSFNQLLSRSSNIHSSIDKNSIDFTKLHPKSALNTNTFYSLKQQDNSQLMAKQFQPTHHLVRTKHDPKVQLKPQQLSKQLKQIQHKISIFLKNSPPSYSSHKDSIQNTKLYTTTYLQKSKLSEMLRNRNNPQNPAQNQQEEQRKQTYNDWYLKAIQTHLKENKQKIDLKYSTQQNHFTKKTVLNQRQIGNTIYPKLSSGFKKRSVSYQIKYI